MKWEQWKRAVVDLRCSKTSCCGRTKQEHEKQVNKSGTHPTHDFSTPRKKSNKNSERSRNKQDNINNNKSNKINKTI